MKHRHARSLASLSLFSLTALTAILALPVQAQSMTQSMTQSTESTEARSATSAQASTAAYTPESSRQDSSATPAREPTREKRKPRWFDERRQQAETVATTASFERLSYTRYEGEAGQGSGSCVYYQSSYTYSCR